MNVLSYRYKGLATTKSKHEPKIFETSVNTALVQILKYQNDGCSGIGSSPPAQLLRGI